MDVRKLSIQQLDQLSEKIGARRAALMREKAGEVRQQIQQLVRSAGLSLADVIGAAVRVAPPKTPKQKNGAAAAAKPGPKKKPGRKPKAKAAAPADGARAVRGMLYANPKNAKEQWKGYGTRPGWFKAAIAAGKSEADLRAK